MAEQKGGNKDQLAGCVAVSLAVPAMVTQGMQGRGVFSADLQDLSKWLGKVVKVLQVDTKKKGVKCCLLETASRKPEEMWLVPATLTKPVASDKAPARVRGLPSGAQLAVARLLYFRASSCRTW